MWIIRSWCHGEEVWSPRLLQQQVSPSLTGYFSVLFPRVRGRHTSGRFVWPAAGRRRLRGLNVFVLSGTFDLHWVLTLHCQDNYWETQVLPGCSRFGCFTKTYFTSRVIRFPHSVTVFRLKPCMSFLLIKETEYCFNSFSCLFIFKKMVKDVELLFMIRFRLFDE